MKVTMIQIIKHIDMKDMWGDKWDVKITRKKNIQGWNFKQVDCIRKWNLD